MDSPKFQVDLGKKPISFTTDAVPNQLPYIKAFIDASPHIFHARPCLNLVERPPHLVQRMQEAIDLALVESKGECSALNNHILQGPPKYHWAAEVYQYIPDNVKAWLENKDPPVGIDSIAVENLSPNMGDYFCVIGGPQYEQTTFYCGSGTSYAAASPAERRTLARQNHRSTTRKPTETLSTAIHKAEGLGLPVTWALALDVGPLEEATVDDLLHFRIVARIGEQILSTITGAHSWEGYNLPV